MLSPVICTAAGAVWAATTDVKRKNGAKRTYIYSCFHIDRDESEQAIKTYVRKEVLFIEPNAGNRFKKLLPDILTYTHIF